MKVNGYYDIVNKMKFMEIMKMEDVEEKWVVALEGMIFDKEEIRRHIHFQEQYFDSEIVM